jgi:hypothetical protein
MKKITTIITYQIYFRTPFKILKNTYKNKEHLPLKKIKGLIVEVIQIFNL